MRHHDLEVAIISRLVKLANNLDNGDTQHHRGEEQQPCSPRSKLSNHIFKTFHVTETLHVEMAKVLVENPYKFTMIFIC
jgi:hypothetical protein